MTAVTATRARTDSAYRLTFARALRGEWIKLTTLRSTWWSIGIVAVLTIGIALLIAAAVEGPGFDGIQAVVSPIQFTMLLAGILGVIAVTGEYSTGMIRSTLTAVPRRGAVLAAKAIVVAGFLFLTSLAIFVVAALAVTPVLAGKGLAIAWDDPAASTLPLVAAAFSMAVFALIGVGFGFVLRSGAGAISATVGVLFVLPIVASLFSVFGAGFQWVSDLGRYLPMAAAQDLILPQSGFGLGAPVAFLTLCGWVVVSMLGGWAVLRGRDA